jgi:diguanylate cyclase (GGDEF)-like protein
MAGSPHRPAPGPARRAALRALFAKREDPYAGADLANARRILALAAALTSVLELVFLPFDPPTHVLGAAGWAVGGLLVAAPLAVARRLARGTAFSSFEWMLGLAYLGMIQIAVLQWLAGGAGGPYQKLFLLWLCAGMGTHPPRRALFMLPATAVVAFLPFAYGGWGRHDAADTVTDVVLWTALGLLVMALMTYVRAQRMRLRAEEERAQQLARTDVLTGLPNRRAFEEALEAELARARRAGSTVSVVLLDIDGFKAINDLHGHMAGDACLREVAEAITGAVRASDRCFRWAGDEFVIMLPDTPREEGDEAATRIAQAIARRTSAPDGSPLAAQYGVAQSGDAAAPADLVAAADMLLMSAKSAREGDASRALEQHSPAPSLG